MPSVPAPIPIPLASLKGLSTLASDERLINCYPEIVGKGNEARAVVYGAAGLSIHSADPQGPCRALFEVDGMAYSVAGQDLYSVSSTGTATSLGTVSGTDQIIWARNAATNPQTFLVSAANYYVLQSNVLSVFSDPDLPSGGVAVEWMDGYFIVALPDGRFFISGINATTFAALDFATAEANPDGLVTVKRLRQELYFFGSRTTEVWVNTGAAAFPFERLPGAVIDSGCASKMTVAEVGDRLYWLDIDGVVQRTAGGYTAEPVSTRGVYDAVRAVADKTSIVGFSYNLGTRNYYVLTHSTFTWVYDASTDLWHERKSRDLTSWTAVYSTICYNRILVGSVADGTVYYIDEDAFAEGSNEMIMVARFPRIDSFPSGGTMSRFEIEIETGVGIATGSADTVSPSLTLRWSDDGSKTWSGGRIIPLGQQGEYRKRVRTQRLGAFGSQGRIMEISVSSKVFRALLAANALVEERTI